MIPRISLCLIARDEEALLPGCLASVEGAVDEIVLVDTGSTDGTVELARAAGARVVLQPWRDDFSLARNEALRHAGGDWVLQLDCDERLAPGAARALRAEVRRAGPPVGLLPLHDATRLDARPEEVLSGQARMGEPCWLPRLLRRLDDLRYEDPLHENVDAFALRHGKQARLVRADIIHLGDVPALRASRGKSQRNVELLRRRCAGSPGDVTAWGHLAMELYKVGAEGEVEARAAAEEGWRRVAGYPRERRILRLAMARALLQLRAGDWPGALASARAASARDGHHPDLDWAGAMALLRLAGEGGPGAAGWLAEAEASFRRALAERETPQTDLCLRGTSSWRSLLGLGQALGLAGRHAEAARAFEEVLRDRPGEAEARLGLAAARLDGGDAAAALSLAEPLLGEGPDAWVLAAAAAQALGAGADAALLATRGAERAGKGFLLPDLQARLRALRGAAAPASRPAAARPAPASAAGPVRRFAVTIVSPPAYPHAEAFREVAEALHHGLLALGHDSVLGTDLSLSGRQHLVLGAHLLAPGQQLPPGAILYNLEQVQEGSPWFGKELLSLYRSFPVWDYSRLNAEALVRLGLPRPRLVPVGFVPQLCRIAPAEEDIDVLFYGSVNERRRAVLEELSRRGARVHVAFGVYGAERDRLVARSRLVLNVHYYEAKVFEIVRVSYLLANRRAVVSETGCDPAGEAELAGAVAFAPYPGLVDACLALLADPERRRRMGEAGLAAMQARPQAEYLRAALAEDEEAGRAAPRPG